MIFVSRLLIGVVLFCSQDLFAPFNFASQNSTINIIGANSSLKLENTMTNVDGTINVKDNVAGTITASDPAHKINFTGGVLKTGKSLSELNVVFDPDSTDAIAMADGNYINVYHDQIVQAISVDATSTATILGQPTFAGAITLDAADSVLQLGISTTLNQSVTGSGKVSLLNDLAVGKNIQMPSLVDQNGKNLHLTGGTISVAVTNQTGGTITLGSNTSMTQTWTIGTGADVYNFNGNGNVLSLSGSGGITFNGGSLYLSNIHIKGLADANPIGGSGIIYLTKVTIELADDFVYGAGTMIIWGEDCKVITNGKTFTVDGGSTNLFVDGVILYFEQLDQSGISPFLTANSGTITESNGGKIANALGTNQPIAITTTTFDLKHNHFLTESSAISFSGQSAIAFDAAGLFVHFPYQAASALFTVAASLDLAVTNIVFKDFNPDAVSIGASGSITYGDGARIELGQNILINALSDSWVFNGDAEIDGNGSTLTITKSDGITITGTKTLTLRNMTLEIGVADAICALADDSIIELDNVTVVIRENGFTVSGGSLYIKNFVKMTGGIGGTLGHTDFSITTNGFLYIQSRSELWIDPNVNLLYDADPSLDTTLAETKNHIQFEQVQSVLTLNGASLTSTATGVLLDVGTLHIIDKVDINPTTDAAAFFEFGQQLQVNMSAGAVIDLTGPATYAEVPPPDPLRYGDSVLVKHAAYGTTMYPAALFNERHFGGPSITYAISSAFACSLTLTSTFPTINDSFYQQSGQFTEVTAYNLQPGDDENMFSSPKLLQAIKSGDMVKVQVHPYPSGWGWGYLMIGFSYPTPSTYFSPRVSSPTPPYAKAAFTGNSDNNREKVGVRIFKHGASIGDAILDNDSVYFQSFMYTDTLAPNIGVQKPAYLGSTNLSTNYGSFTSGEYKEVFWYVGSTISEVPPNFSTDYLWNLELEYPAGYTGTPRSISIPADNVNNSMYTAGVFSGWPAASGYQY